MNWSWRFLRDKRNQRVLGWIGGGLVFVATGLWQPLSISFLSSKLLRRKLQSSLELRSLRPFNIKAGLWCHRHRWRCNRRDYHVWRSD
jgi:hypothetical protein